MKVSNPLGLGRLAKPHVGLLVASTLLLALHALTTGAYAYLVGPLLRFVYSGGETAGTGMSSVLVWLGWEPSSDPAQLTSFIAVTVVVLVVAKGVAYFGGSYFVALAGQRMEHQVRTLLYGHLLRIAYVRLSEIPRGDMVSRFIMDVAAMKFAVTHGWTNILREVLQVIVLGSLAIYLDPVLGVITLCILPVTGTVIIRIGQRLRSRRRKAQDAYGELASAAEQTSAALPVLRACGAEAHARDNFDDLSNMILRRNLRAWALQIFSSPLMELLGALALAGTLWYAGQRISSGALAPEEFVSFFAAVFMMYRPIKSLGEASGHLHNGLAALDRINVILALPVEPADDPDDAEVDHIDHNVAFDNVTFVYPPKDDDEGGEEVTVLDEASFDIEAGQTLALVGPSGAGKTTIAMLLLRLVEPQAGRITIDGRDISTVKRASLRQLFGLVNQDPVLLHDTVDANITFGLDVTPERIEAAAESAGALAFIKALPDGLQSSVGESGTRLSGGERQRICIARALLRDPPALILDEATAAVDSATEAEIAASLESLMEGRTTLLISHRLSTVRRADRIVVVERGRVVDQGTYEDLADSSEAFRRVFADQLSLSSS